MDVQMIESYPEQSRTTGRPTDPRLGAVVSAKLKNRHQHVGYQGISSA